MSVAMKSNMLSVIILNVIMLNVAASFLCHYYYMWMCLFLCLPK
jgi:hypothetical protein